VNKLQPKYYELIKRMGDIAIERAKTCSFWEWQKGSAVFFWRWQDNLTIDLALGLAPMWIDSPLGTASYNET